MMSERSAEPKPSLFLRVILPAVIFSAAIAIPTLLFLNKPTPPRSEAVPLEPLVETASIQSAPASFDIVTTGTVVPKREVAVAAEVSGKIISKSPECDEGHFVKAGTLLVEIDPSKYELQLSQLESELRQTQIDALELQIDREKNESLIALAEEDVTIAQRELERVERLFRSASASASEKDQQSSRVMQVKNAYQQLVSQRALLEQRAEKIENQRRIAETRLKLAQLDLERTKIVAPIDGYITEDMVETSAFAQPGSALFRIEDRSAVEVRCALRVDDLFWLTGSDTLPADTTPGEWQDLYRAPHVPAVVSYEIAGKECTWDNAFLSRYEGTGVNEKSRTIPCRVEVPAPDAQRVASGVPTLLRGMFVTVKLRATPRTPLVAVPSIAFRPNDEVWILIGSELRIRQARVARMLDDSILLYADDELLKPGAEVVVSPLSVAIDGMKVRRPEQPTTGPGRTDQKGIAREGSDQGTDAAPPPRAALSTDRKESG